MPFEPFVIQRTVLFGDCDASKNIYAPILSHYIAESAGKFLDYRFGRPHIRDCFRIKVSLSARVLISEFIRPMTWDDEIDIHVYVGELRSRAFSIDIRGLDCDGNEMLKGRLTYVCVSMDTGKAVAIPEPWRVALQD